MEESRALLLDVWREACRHIEIGESTATIAAMLQAQMPVGLLVVRRFDWDRGCVETVATGFAGPDAPVPEVKSECSDAQKRAVLAWCDLGKIARRIEPSSDSGIAALVPPGSIGDVVAGAPGRCRHPPRR